MKMRRLTLPKNYTESQGEKLILKKNMILSDFDLCHVLAFIQQKNREMSHLQRLMET